MTDFLLDTNAINAALDKKVDPALFTARGPVFVTHIQVNELRATKNPEGRRQALLDALQKIDPSKVRTSAMVWDVSEWDGADWGDPKLPYQPLLEELNARNGSKKNNPHDALIGVTALARNMTLVTDDIDLGAVVREFGGAVESFAEFITR